MAQLTLACRKSRAQPRRRCASNLRVCNFRFSRPLRRHTAEPQRESAGLTYDTIALIIELRVALGSKA